MRDASVTYRRATPSDRQVALAISAQFPNDWLCYGIDRMTAEGRFYVAEQDGRVIALCGYHGLGEVAWLHAMRVDREVHNRGVATAFTRYLMEECREAGFRLARLDTEVTNHPVHHLVGEKLGFRRRCKFFDIEGPVDRPLLTRDATGDTSGNAIDDAGEDGSLVIRPATAADLEASWAFLVHRVSEGHLQPLDLAPCPENGWEIGPFGPATLAGWIEKGHVLLAGKPDQTATGVLRLAGLAGWRKALHEPEDGREPVIYLNVSYLEGQPSTQAVLLASSIERSQVSAAPVFVNIGLIESQWRTLWPLLDPAWVIENGEVFEAVIYDKDLA